MQDHYQTAIQAIKNIGDYLKPSSFRVTHRLNDVNGLAALKNQYDLFILDRDGTLQEWHGKNRVPEFEDVLRQIAGKSELVSNSSYDTFLKIRDLYSGLMPVSKAVIFETDHRPFLLRFVKGNLRVLSYYGDSGVLSDETAKMATGDKLHFKIAYNFKKPDPLVLRAVVNVNKNEERIPRANPRVLMVGDRYLTDIVAGNNAGLDTATVKPYRPLTDSKMLIAVRYLVDLPVGGLMSRLGSKK